MSRAFQETENALAAAARQIVKDHGQTAEGREIILRYAAFKEGAPREMDDLKLRHGKGSRATIDRWDP